MITLSICWTAVLIIIAVIAAIGFLFFIMHKWLIEEKTWAKIVGICITISVLCFTFLGYYFKLAEIYCN